MPTASAIEEVRTLEGLVLDEHTCTLAASALRGESDRRRRAAVRLSGELEAERRTGAKKDIRAGALEVVRVLAEADALDAAAVALEVSWDAGAASPVAIGDASPGDDDDDEDDEVAELDEAPGLDDPDLAAARAALGAPVVPEPEVAPAG